MLPLKNRIPTDLYKNTIHTYKIHITDNTKTTKLLLILLITFVLFKTCECICINGR